MFKNCSIERFVDVFSKTALVIMVFLTIYIGIYGIDQGLF